jgi:hypothetical protein
MKPNLRPAVLFVVMAGCEEHEPPAPDISELRVAIDWEGGSGARTVDVSLVNEIPCEGAKDGWLGEEGVECTSGPWTLTVDGSEIPTTEMECTSAHDGLFGLVTKRCGGGRAFGSLPEVESEDVEIVVTNDVDEVRLLIPGVRAIHPFETEESPSLSILEPAIIRVEGLDLVDDDFVAIFTSKEDAVPPHELYGRAEWVKVDDGDTRLELEASRDDDVVDYADVYDVRIRASAELDRMTTVALMLEGSLTVDEG